MKLTSTRRRRVPGCIPTTTTTHNELSQSQTRLNDPLSAPQPTQHTPTHLPALLTSTQQPSKMLEQQEPVEVCELGKKKPFEFRDGERRWGVRERGGWGGLGKERVHSWREWRDRRNSEKMTPFRGWQLEKRSRHRFATF